MVNLIVPSTVFRCPMRQSHWQEPAMAGWVISTKWHDYNTPQSTRIRHTCVTVATFGYIRCTTTCLLHALQMHASLENLKSKYPLEYECQLKADNQVYHSTWFILSLLFQQLANPDSTKAWHTVIAISNTDSTIYIPFGYLSYTNVLAGWRWTRGWMIPPLSFKQGKHNNYVKGVHVTGGNYRVSTYHLPVECTSPARHSHTSSLCPCSLAM